MSREPATSADAPAGRKLHIVNLSHLAWERRLFQRPQQLMQQFAMVGDEVSYFSLVGLRRYLKMFPEERICRIDGASTAMNLPFLPFSKSFGPSRGMTMALLRSRARVPLERAPAGRRVLWLQNPAYVDEVDRLPHDLMVYDVMDPFAAFRTSDGEVVGRERRVLEKADLVFTGGRSLHSQVAGRHSRAHCFPSGIDYPHFAKGAAEGPIPEDLRSIRKPVFGYFGAIDERIDWELMRELCRAHRDWSVVFLGPLVLIDRVPMSEPNFQWLGAKPYDALPDYLRGLDVCLIPWLVNDLTRFMSPTKTPEYLAAGRPVVSTPIPDVMADYAGEVLIGATAEEYGAQCAKALAAGTGPARKPPQSLTWGETAAEMRRLIVEALA